jgi:CBS domain-containing protein
MKVKEIMSAEARTCTRATNVAEAAALMLDGDCGILPVLDDGRLAGVVTDRDMYIALATRNRRASELTVGDVIQAPAHTCAPDDELQAALETMKQHRVRRLPVEGFNGAVMGILSLDDIVRVAGQRQAVREADVIDALRAICGGHHPAPHVAVA